jgi:drug/metabolite transporter (DMT)-like permease
MVLVGGSNAVAVRFSNLELPPFWGAAIRFTAAALIFWIIVLVRRIPLPRGRALIGVSIFGIMAIGINYALLYWALLEITAGFTMVVGAFVPLLTLLFALAHGQEPFRWRGLLGAFIAIAGILIAVGGGLGTDVPIASLLALIISIAFLAEASVVLKLFPPTDPLATNAISVTIGSVFLLVISLVVGEQWSIPSSSETWLSFFYLLLFGTVILFYLYLFILSRWTASATNYAFLLFPIVTVVMAAWLLGEEVTVAFAIGGAIVLLGVWIGAFGGPAKSAEAEKLQPQEEVTG